MGANLKRMDKRVVLNIGTRGSKLALAQTALVEQQLVRAHSDIRVNVVRITTHGDRVQDRPLSQVGGKALFVAEIETALRDGRIQLAVHSAKDMPSALPEDMRIAACLPRADSRDVFVSNSASSIASLPSGARVGTSSPRRACQLRALRADLDVRDIRGNVDTRLAKLDNGDFDAIILAAAGLSRIGLLHRVTDFIPFTQMLPCAGQGIIALEVLSTDTHMLSLLAALNDEPSSVALTAERSFALTIGGSCDTPMAAHARVDTDIVTLSAMLGSPSGKTISGTIAGTAQNATDLGMQLARQLLANGGTDLLQESLDRSAPLRESL